MILSYDTGNDLVQSCSEVTISINSEEGNHGGVRFNKTCGCDLVSTNWLHHRCSLLFSITLSIGRTSVHNYILGLAPVCNFKQAIKQIHYNK